MPRGRSNRPSGIFRHPSTRFWLRLRIWRMKSRRPSLNELEISAGFASKLFSCHTLLTLLLYYFDQSLTRPPPYPLSLPAKPPPQTMQPPVPIINIHTDDAFGKRSAGEEEPVVSGERQGGRKLSIRGQHDRQRRKRKDSSPAMSVGSGASTPVSAAEDGAEPLTMKRLKTSTDVETPSLLLRMGHPRRLSPAAGSRNTSKSRSDSPRHRGPPSAGMPDISLGISIKGAARSHSHSLLERIQGNGT